MTLPLVRANKRLFTRNSTAIRINGARVTDIESIEWSDERQAELIESFADNSQPLDVALGKYGCTASISVYADAASQFEDLALGTPAGGVTSALGVDINLADADPFNMTIQLSEDTRTRSVNWLNCTIVGRPSRTVGDDGKAIVMKYAIQPRLIIDDGKSLVNLVGETIGSGFDNQSSALNSLLVKGVKSPGRAQISGCDIPFNWQIQEGYGIDAAWMTFRGRGLIRFSVTLSLWKTEHFIEFPDWLKTVSPPARIVPTPGKVNDLTMVQVGHPILTLMGVSAATPLKLGAPVRQGNGIWLASSEWIEWRKPLPALAKPDKSVPPGAKGPTPKPPQAAVDIALVNSKAGLQAAVTGKPAPTPVPEGGG